MRFLIKNIAIASAIGALSISNVFGSEVGVQSSATHSSGHTDCNYQITNHTKKPIIGFVLGAGDQAGGPNELTMTPLGLHAPRGWTFEVLSPDPNRRLAVEWETRDDAESLKPEQTLDGLTIRYDLNDMPCDGIHWTAVNRDSELISGIVE